MIYIGLDFGTTNSSVGLYDGKKLHLFNLDVHNQDSRILPSLIYISRQKETCVGRRAGELFIDQDTGRLSRWESRKVGQVQMTVAGRGGGPITYWEDLIIEIDTGARGRLLQSIKTALRDFKYEGTRIFEQEYTIEELITIILKALFNCVVQEVGDKNISVVMGRPVKFSDNPDVNTRAEKILMESAKQAGFIDVSFELEPIGAAYLYHATANSRQNIFIFDFGGGTLDLTVMEVGSNISPKVLASQGVLIGGDDFDSILMRRLLKYFGEGVMILDQHDGILYPFPHYLVNSLVNWQNMSEASRPQYRRVIELGKKYGDNPQAIQAFDALVTQKHGYKLFREIERAKTELSSEIKTTIRYEAENIHINEEVTRYQFEEMIKPQVEEISLAIDSVVKASGITFSQLDIVLRTGGSSSIPVFVQMLEDKFGVHKVRSMDQFTSVVGGLSVIAHERTIKGVGNE